MPSVNTCSQHTFDYQHRQNGAQIWKSGGNKQVFLELSAQLTELTSTLRNHASVAKIISIVSRNTASICKVLEYPHCVILIAALVDYKRRFLDIEIGWPGSVRDAWVFENSCLANTYIDALAALGTSSLASGEDIIENILAFILGDSAYKNAQHFVTTYKVTECDTDTSVRHLNAHLSRARYQVEHAFGLLKCRFQIFKSPLQIAAEDLPFAIHLITSICVMHNFLIDSQDAVNDQPEFEQEVEEAVQEAAQDAENSGVEDANEDELRNEDQNVREVTRNALL